MILPEISEFRVFLKPGTTDMRKSINGLSAMVQNEFKMNLYDKSLFLFSNRRMDMVKILYWDRNGFCIWHKRLEADRFPWPQNTEDVQEITTQELKWLLSGIDFRRVHKELQYRKTG